MPSFRTVLFQVGMSSLDWAFAGSIIYILLPAIPGFSFLKFLSVFLLAQVAGLASQIPGGLGIFETVTILFVPPDVPRHQLMGSLLVFRGIYYILPLLAAGILFSLLKGFDYEEAIILSVMLIAFLPCHRYFRRKGSFISGRFSAGWISSILLVLLCSIWLGMFSFKHVDYSNDLWWSFTVHGDAPRFMRAMVGVLCTVFIIIIWRFLNPAHPDQLKKDTLDMAIVLPVVRASGSTHASLALLGDKSFLFNRKNDAFIMYGISGRSWIAMGDPIGPKDEWAELIWRFREICDGYNGWPVFYEVRAENLYLYLDIGLSALKIGEEGKVSLQDFSLEGGISKNLRYTVRRIERDGYNFRIIPGEDVLPLLHEFKSISDSWLKNKATREKGFSLGFFDGDYLKNFPAGIIEKEGRIVAFTNIFTGAGKKELSIDLMRYVPEVHNSLMEYMFIKLMLWGREQGYGWFNLGMAPFSGFESRELATLWHRTGALIFRYGEHFYNLQGLRQYKEKFNPVWEPKYLASPGGLFLPRVLANISSLISGNLKGLVAK